MVEGNLLGLKFSIQIGFEPLPKTTDRPECLFGKVRSAWEHSAFSSLSPRISLNQKEPKGEGEDRRGEARESREESGKDGDEPDRQGGRSHTRGEIWGNFAFPHRVNLAGITEIHHPGPNPPVSTVPTGRFVDYQQVT